MNSKRLEMLKAYILEDPNDPFNWYAMAMEYAPSDPKKAFEILTKILDEFSGYLPAYYQAGTLAHQVGQTTQALNILEKGIELAKLNGDSKALQELRNVLNELQYE